LSLDGKLTVVADHPGGLGLGIGREFARNGRTVIITSRNKSNLKKVCNLIDKNCYGFQLNVSKKRSLVKFIENISKDFSNIDILINNAGFPLEWKIWLKNVHDISEVELMNIIQVDLIGSFRVTREIIKLMMKKRVELSSIFLQPLPYPDIFAVLRTL
jgi:3-oxoacyl-[acyl-carrier protein] reductase